MSFTSSLEVFVHGARSDPGNNDEDDGQDDSVDPLSSEVVR